VQLRVRLLHHLWREPRFEVALLKRTARSCFLAADNFDVRTGGAVLSTAKLLNSFRASTFKYIRSATVSVLFVVARQCHTTSRSGLLLEDGSCAVPRAQAICRHGIGPAHVPPPHT